MGDESSLCCPTCRARFRQSRTCPRCGTELTPLMLLAAGAYRLRQAAAAALRVGDPDQAHALAGRAHTLHATARSRRLLAITTLLTRPAPRKPGRS